MPQFLGADRLLRPGGMLCVYGPFLQGAGGRRSLSSRVFDAALWLQSSEYGLRGLNELNEAAVRTRVESEAAAAGPTREQPLTTADWPRLLVAAWGWAGRGTRRARGLLRRRRACCTGEAERCHGLGLPKHLPTHRRSRHGSPARPSSPSTAKTCRTAQTRASSSSASPKTPRGPSRPVRLPIERNPDGRAATRKGNAAAVGNDQERTWLLLLFTLLVYSPPPRLWNSRSAQVAVSISLVPTYLPSLVPQRL